MLKTVYLSLGSNVGDREANLRAAGNDATTSGYRLIPFMLGLISTSILARVLSKTEFGLVAIAIVGVVISIYYYFGVMRAIFWSREAPDLTPILPSLAARLSLYACIAGMLLLGVYPSPLVNWATQAVQVLK